MSKTRKTRTVSSSDLPLKAEAKFVFRSVRTGKAMDCISFVPNGPARYVALLVPHTRDWLFRAEGVTDEEWAVAVPKLNAIKRTPEAKHQLVFVGPKILSGAPAPSNRVGRQDPE
jgi:hypothetical protein